MLVKKIKFLLGKPQLLTGSRPVIAVALSSGLYYPEQGVAQELLPSGNTDSTALQQPGHIDNTAAFEHAEHLSVSGGIGIENSTEFFRKLLLSHGVAVDVGENDTIDIRRFTHILESIKHNLSESQATDIDLDSSLEFTLLVDENDLLSTPIELDETRFLGTEERWHTVWIQEEIPSGSEPHVAQIRNNDGIPDYIEPRTEQTTFSGITLVPDEPVDAPSTQSLSQSSRAASDYEYREDDFPILRKWIVSLGLDIDFDSECQIAVAVALEMHGDIVASKRILESQTPINANTPPPFADNVSDEWEIKELDCDLSAVSATDIDELIQLNQSLLMSEPEPGSFSSSSNQHKQSESISAATGTSGTPSSTDAAGTSNSSSLTTPNDSKELATTNQSTFLPAPQTNPLATNPRAPDAPTNLAPTEIPDTDAEQTDQQSNAFTGKSNQNSGAAATDNDIPKDIFDNANELPNNLPSNPASNPAGRAESKKSGETQQGIFAVSDDVPAGFEDLAGPQSRFVDVYFNNRKVGDTSITVIDTEFLFDVADEVAAMLSGIKDEVDVIGLLSQTLPTNGHLVCYALNDPPGCGIVNPDPLSAIYDDNQLRVDLFFAAGVQSIQSLHTDQFLPGPTNKNSSILTLSAVASDIKDQDSGLDLGARSIFGYGRGNFKASADYNSRTEQYNIRELNLTHYLDNYALVAGTAASPEGGALPSIDIIGLGLSTSYETRIDLEQVFGTELVVFLQRRSLVQLDIDGRVYSGASYEAGNQALDTSALPDGTYDVNILIIDPVTGNRTETRTFTKSAQIPPKSETVWAFAAGEIVDTNASGSLPKSESATLLSASMARRVNDQSAVRLGILNHDKYPLFQAEYFYLGKQFLLQFGSSVGNENTLATSSNVSLNYKGLQLSLNHKRFSSDVIRPEESYLESFYPSNFEQWGLAANKSFGKFSFGANGNFRRNLNDSDDAFDRQFVLYLRRQFKHRHQLRSYIDINLEEAQNKTQLNFKWNVYFKRNRWKSSVSTELQTDSDRAVREAFGLDINLDSDPDNATKWSLGGHTHYADDTKTLGADLDIKTSKLKAHVSTEWSESALTNDKHNTIASAITHIGFDKLGASLGGADYTQAGVIVDVQGEPQGALFDIHVNKTKMGTGSIGQSSFIGLRPFEQYELKLIPKSVLSNGLAEQIYDFTLFPGSIERIQIVAVRKILLLATLVTETGDLVQNAIIKTDDNQLLVKEDGFIQAELTVGDSVSVRLQNGSSCSFVVPETDETEILIVDDPLVCKPEA